jgi:hypothetical protein
MGCYYSQIKKGPHDVCRAGTFSGDDVVLRFASNRSISCLGILFKSLARISHQNNEKFARRAFAEFHNSLRNTAKRLIFCAL